MIRRLLATCFFVAAVGVLSVRAEEPKKTNGTRNEKNAQFETVDALLDKAHTQEELNKARFEEFKSKLIRLADRLGSSSDPAVAAKSKTLRKAIEKVNELGTEIKFDKLVDALKESKEL